MGGIATQARAAFAVGWASTASPMTARVQAASRAAVRLAVEHADQPGVLEATLHLGSLEGTWSAIYARRDKLYAQHTRAVMATFRTLAGGLDAAGLVAEFRRQVGLTETTTDQQQRRDREATAIAVALAALHRLITTTGDKEFQAVVAAVEQGLRDGVAEGTAGAIAIAAQQLGHTSVAFDRAFTDARAALVDVEQYKAQATDWAGRMVDGAARDLGRRLARHADDGDSETAMVATASNTGRKGWFATAAAAVTDWAMGHAFGLGATAVYAALSVASINWITVGDGKVCARCDALESGSPYMLFGAPAPPAHPRCRCTTVPAGVVASLGQFAQYLIGA